MHILVLVNTCGLMAACAVVYSFAQFHIPSNVVRRCVIGLAFGLAGIVAMLQPLEIEPGIFADARGAFIGMATAFGGPIAAVIAVTLTIIARLIIGGSGAVLGVAVIIITACLAGLWLQVYKNYQTRNYRSWIMLTLACAIPSFIALHSLPEAHTQLGLFLAALTAALVFSFGKLLHGEQRRARRERQLARAASTDILTGLPNRRAFDQYARQLEEAGTENVMLLLLDVDSFKGINDELGHDAGDAVLQGIAQAIRETVRETDYAGRIGGEEFAVIVHTAGKDSGYQIAERFRQAVQVPYGLPGKAQVSTISVGGFCFNGKPFCYVDGYKKADEALYHSKRTGRNKVTLSPYLQAA